MRLLPRNLRPAGWLALAGGLSACAPIARADLSIEPAYIEVKLDGERVAETIKVRNVTDRESRFRAQAVHFIYTKEGGFLAVAPDSHSLASWIKFNPREFTLAPQETQLIRVSLNPPPDVADGEYWGAIHFEPLVGRTVRGDDQAGHTMQLNIITNILLPVVAQAGEVTYGAELRSFEAARDSVGIALTAQLANVGTARVRLLGRYELVDAAGQVFSEGLLGEDTILTGGERIFKRHIPGTFPDQGCTARVRYTSPRFESVLAGQTTVRALSAEAPPIVSSGGGS